MKLCSMLCGSLHGREVWGGMDTRVCMAESLRCSLSVSYIPTQNEKFKVWKKSTSCRLNNRWNSKCAKLGYAQCVMQIHICQDCTVVHKVDFKPDSCRLTLSPWALLSIVHIWLTHTHTHTHSHTHTHTHTPPGPIGNVPEMWWATAA